MQNKLIEIYMSKPIVNVDFNLACDVNCDNIHAKLNEIYNEDWVCEITEIQDSILATLYIPGRILTGIANTKTNVSMGETVACAMAIAFTNGYSKKNNKESLNNISAPVVSINDIPPEVPISLLNNESSPQVKEPAKTNQFGIRDEQITFMNNFKNKNNIDTNEKFDCYVKIWSENTGNEIATKAELIKAGEKKVDDFIKWIIFIEQTNAVLGIV